MEIISISGLIRLMISTIIALGMIIIWGLYYPRIKMRGNKVKTNKNITFGSEKMFNKLENYNASANFNEGIIFAYNLLKTNLSNMENYPEDKSLTELETIKKTSTNIAELANISNLLLSAYQQYELARFRAKTDSKNLLAMNEILRKMITHNKFIIQKVEI